jgi:transcription elongation GreA/GreB family factor
MASLKTVSKQKLIESLVAQLTAELEAMTQAARAAHEAATHEESRAEDQHDTRGLEASYLAGAQAARASELAQTIAYYRALPVAEWGESRPVAPGALVELELGERRTLYFLVAQGGGLTVNVDGARIQVITPRAPLGEALLGRVLGEPVEVEAQGQLREYVLVGVR